MALRRAGVDSGSRPVHRPETTDLALITPSTRCQGDPAEPRDSRPRPAAQQYNAACRVTASATAAADARRSARRGSALRRQRVLRRGAGRRVPPPRRAPVKRALREIVDLDPGCLGDIYSSVVRHGYDGIDDDAFQALVRVQVAGKHYPGWVSSASRAAARLTQLASYHVPPTRLEGRPEGTLQPRLASTALPAHVPWAGLTNSPPPDPGYLTFASRPRGHGGQHPPRPLRRRAGPGGGRWVRLAV